VTPLRVEGYGEGWGGQSGIERVDAAMWSRSCSSTGSEGATRRGGVRFEVVVVVVETRSDDGDDNPTPVPQVRWGRCGADKFLGCLLPIGPCVFCAANEPA
jgi:hypothetical protein